MNAVDRQNRGVEVFAWRVRCPDGHVRIMPGENAIVALREAGYPFFEPMPGASCRCDRHVTYDARRLAGIALAQARAEAGRNRHE